jgi:hypothetical protein
LDYATHNKVIISLIKKTYCAESLGKLKNFIPLCLLYDEHPGAFLAIYTARNNTLRVSSDSTDLPWAKPKYA